jgi:protein-tyrosine-phosphatase
VCTTARGAASLKAVERSLRGVLRSAKRGLEKGRGVNPLAAAVMQEIDIDISGKPSQEVFDVYKSGQLFAYVITVCSESEGAGCPIFPGPAKRLHWPFADPSSFTGTWEEKLEQTRKVRDEIAARSRRGARKFASRNRRQRSGRGLLGAKLRIAKHATLYVYERK